MSSLVLLDGKGLVARKLQLISLPDDYLIPEGMTVSWRMDMRVSSRDPLANFRRSEPVEAYFYLGNAQGQVCRGEVQMYDRDDRSGQMRYGSRILTITVQGTSAKDVMKLRDRIMQLIETDASWEVSNDLNPKPRRELFRRLSKLWGG